MKLRALLTITIFTFIITAVPLVLAGGDKVKEGANAAGHIQGNGGDVLYCPSLNGPGKYEMLDLYEAKARWKIEIDFGAPELSPMEKVNYVLDRLQRIDQFRAEYYRKVASEFFDNALFIPDITLIDIPDSQFSYIPSHCSLEQIAIQKEPQFPGEKLYTVSKDLWDLLDNDQKAGLILHEIVFGEAIKEGHENSINTRYFMGQIASNKTSNISLIDYTGLLGLTFFADMGIMVNNIKYLMKGITFHENGNVKFGYIHYRRGECLDDEGHYWDDFECSDTITREIRGNVFKFVHGIEFFENGEVKKGILAAYYQEIGTEPYYYDYKTDYDCTHKLRPNPNFNFDLSSPGEWIEFTDEGKLKHVEILGDFIPKLLLLNPNSKSCYELAPFHQAKRDESYSLDFFENGMVKSIFATHLSLPVYKSEIHFTKERIVSFHDNGYVASGEIQKNERLMTTKNEYKWFDKGSNLDFNTEGKVIVQ